MTGRRPRKVIEGREKAVALRETYTTQQELAFIRRLFFGFPAGLLLLVGLAAFLAPYHLFPFFVALRIATTRRGSVPVRAESTPPPSKDSQEKELLEALARRGQITPASAALETSLSVAQAEEMLSELASEGHLEVGTHAGASPTPCGNVVGAKPGRKNCPVQQNVVPTSKEPHKEHQAGNELLSTQQQR